MKNTVISLAAACLLSGCMASTSGNHGSNQADLTNALPSTCGDAIPNITLVENQVKAYYGDTVAADGQHLPAETGNYAKEVARSEAKAKSYLAHYRSHSTTRLAIVLDVDDTSLNTYNYEISCGFAYSKPTNDLYVDGQKFPAVFGMPELTNWAADNGGYTVFFITGRPEAQREATAGNLGKVGFTVPTDAAHLFLRNETSPPSYLAYCEPKCTTIQYKSGTRAYIESLGYEIAADFGDQYSDLKGGHSGRTFKLPNPMYYLP